MKKNIIVLISSIIVIVTIVIILIVVFLNNKLIIREQTIDSQLTNQINTNATGDTTTQTTSTNTANNTNDTATMPVEGNDKATIYSLSRFFTEQFGSYSTDSNNENIIQLRSFMTDTMQAAADTTINQTSNTTMPYYGVSTQAITINIIDYSLQATGATVEVATRRTETTNVAGQPKIFSQTARLQLKKLEQIWKVDNFKWL